MKVYLAIITEQYFPDLIEGADILSSYYYCRDEEDIIRDVPKMRNFLLDSGIFTMINTGKRVDIDKYAVEYAAFVKANGIKNYVELDMDQIIGVEKTRILRDKLENMVGWQSIPVWHTIRGKESFLQDCKDYNYIALGYFITEGISNGLTVKYAKAFVDTAHKYNCRIHGLGFTKTTLLKDIPFDSVDSSSWAASHRYGCMFKFDAKEGIVRTIPKPKGYRMKHCMSMSHPAFKEWRMYQDYAHDNIFPIWQ